MDAAAVFSEYAKRPPNKARMANATVSRRENARSCSDDLEVFLKVAKNGTVEAFSFWGDASFVAAGSTAMVGERVVGMSAKDLLKLDEKFLLETIGIEVSPRRRNASLLGLVAIRNAAHAWLNDGKEDGFGDVETR